MPGNEISVCRFLFENIGSISLNHLGVITSIGAPNNNSGGYIPITSHTQINLVVSNNANKKADIYLNNIGISVKQSGASFSYNRLQRANLQNVYTTLGFANINQMLQNADDLVIKFHRGVLTNRNRPWSEFFTETDFKLLLEYLMMQGSPNVGMSLHPAKLILEAPPSNISKSNMAVYTFDEYFSKYKDKLWIAIRRQWIGQKSKSEHGRACSLSRKLGNTPWVFNDVAGYPSRGWQPDFPSEDRKTVYFLMVEKVN